MDTVELTKEYDLAEQSDDIIMINAFISKLLDLDGPDSITYHYDLLHRRKNRYLYLRVRSALKQRGAEAEAFLIKKLPTESNVDMQSDIVLLLGLMRSREARRIALEFLTSKEPKLRHFAGVLLGWVGPESDLTKLGSLLLTDEDPRVRGAGAGAQCQMWYRIPKIKSRLLWYSKQAIERETDEEVQQDIVIMVQTVLKKRLGIKENIDEGTITGDIPKAVIKTKKLLETLDQEGLLQKP